MLSTTLQTRIKETLSTHLNTSIEQLNFQPVGGGSINDSFQISTNKQHFFLKKNNASKFPQLLQKEYDGLQLIAQTKVIKTPLVIDCFVCEHEQILILEWIEYGVRTKQFWERFGEQLAQLHYCTSGYFGLNEDNYMGSVAQSNKPSNAWVHFFIQQRLRPLLKQCADKKLLSSKQLNQFEIVHTKLPLIFNEENPALVHGDLWSGNFMCDGNNQPLLIDPAVYYGHRSVDLAMTTLFGGFHEPFYQSYHYHFPLPKNYEEQWQICNLYPLLVHLLLFGSSYLAQIQEILNRFA